jgi:hypothetical protein
MPPVPSQPRPDPGAASDGADKRVDDPAAWADHQAVQLRRVAAGETQAAVDWPGVIGEIAAVGVAERNATRILLRQAMALLLHVRGWPDHADRSVWLIALGGTLADLAIRLTPSIRPHLDLGALYQQARAQFAGVALDGQLPRPFPTTCPFTLDDLLRGDRAQLDGLLAPNEDL